MGTSMYVSSGRVSKHRPCSMNDHHQRGFQTRTLSNCGCVKLLWGPTSDPDLPRGWNRSETGGGVDTGAVGKRSVRENGGSCDS